MSNEFRQVDLMIGDVRRRRWTPERKLQIIEESYAAVETFSSAARRHGVAPDLLYHLRRLLSEGGAAAMDSDEPVTGGSLPFSTASGEPPICPLSIASVSSHHGQSLNDPRETHGSANRPRPRWQGHGDAI